MLKTFSYSVFSLVLLWMFSSCISVFPMKKQVTAAVHSYEIHAASSMHEAGFIEATVADETGTDEMAAAAETNYLKYNQALHGSTYTETACLPEKSCVSGCCSGKYREG
jgi:hypothetical protein